MIQLLNLDPMQYAVLFVLIAGSTELVTRLRAKDYWTAVTIGTSALIGGLLGLSHYQALDLISGIAAGLAASGTLTTLGFVGNKSSAAPTPVVK